MSTPQSTVETEYALAYEKLIFQAFQAGDDLAKQRVVQRMNALKEKRLRAESSGKSLECPWI